jgi:hypothetical protein
MSRSLVHVLLSLLLLITQQMALDHGLTHRGQAASVVLVAQESMQDAGPAPAHGGNPAKPVLHHLCSHCAAGAQLAFMLPVLVFAFVPQLPSSSIVTSHRADGIWRLATRAFDPRGPPSGK